MCQGMGRGGFEPPKAEPEVLQTPSLNHSDIFPRNPQFYVIWEDVSAGSPLALYGSKKPSDVLHLKVKVWSSGE